MIGVLCCVCLCFDGSCADLKLYTQKLSTVSLNQILSVYLNRVTYVTLSSSLCEQDLQQD